jgi:hypothetical protein
MDRTKLEPDTAVRSPACLGLRAAVLLRSNQKEAPMQKLVPGQRYLFVDRHNATVIGTFLGVNDGMLRFDNVSYLQTTTEWHELDAADLLEVEPIDGKVAIRSYAHVLKHDRKTKAVPVVVAAGKKVKAR